MNGTASFQVTPRTEAQNVGGGRRRKTTPKPPRKRKKNRKGK